MIRIGSLDYKFEIYFFSTPDFVEFTSAGVWLRNLELFTNLANKFRVTLSVLRLKHNFDSALLLLFGQGVALTAFG